MFLCTILIFAELLLTSDSKPVTITVAVYSELPWSGLDINLLEAAKEIKEVHLVNASSFNTACTLFDPVSINFNYTDNTTYF